MNVIECAELGLLVVAVLLLTLKVTDSSLNTHFPLT